VSQNRTALFGGRHFEDVIIILCVRWYLRYSLSYRDLEEMMMECGMLVDHVTMALGPALCAYFESAASS
jgi:transposase-like protein